MLSSPKPFKWLFQYVINHRNDIIRRRRWYDRQCDTVPLWSHSFWIPYRTQWSTRCWNCRRYAFGCALFCALKSWLVKRCRSNQLICDDHFVCKQKSIRDEMNLCFLFLLFRTVCDKVLCVESQSERRDYYQQRRIRL